MIEDFVIACRARNLSPATVKTYRLGCERFERWAAARDRDLLTVSRRDIEAWVISMQDEGLSPRSIHAYFEAVSAFFRWAISAGHKRRHPMERMKRPQSLTPEPVPMLTDDEIRRLLGDCWRPNFEDARDGALIRVMLDNGIRIGEITKLRLADLDLPHGLMKVDGKGGRWRTIPIGSDACENLIRYLDFRRSHRLAALPTLWLGTRGRMSDSGIRTMLQRRGRRAGIERRIFPHLLRRTFASMFKRAGGNDSDLMRIGGWRSHAGIIRYTDDHGEALAKIAHVRLSPNDRLTETL